jgi:hypothetical protein
VVILEQTQFAGLPWLLWIEEWLQDMANLAVLFVVDIVTPLPLDDARLEASQDPWLQWLRKELASGTAHAHLVDVGRVSRADITDLLAPSVGEQALDLYDEAHAPALGMLDGGGQLEDFQSLLDDALCRDEDGVGVLEQLAAPVKLAKHELATPFRYMARYRIVLPVLRSILFNYQQAVARRAGGQRLRPLRPCRLGANSLPALPRRGHNRHHWRTEVDLLRTFRN